MEHDEQPRMQPRELRTERGERNRDEALARYDAHPGIAITLLAVMAFIFIVIVYEFASDRADNTAFSSRNLHVPRQNPLIGLPVLSSERNKIGTVKSVDGEPDGKITVINIATGSFLGLGAKLVAIPGGKFTRVGDTMWLGMTAEEVSKLPELKDGS